MIVVTGATGNVGRPLVQALAAAGEQVTALSRRPPEAGTPEAGTPEAGTPEAGTPEAGTPEAVRHQRADLADPESLRPVLDGADALFLLVAGELIAAGEDPGGILDVAKASGVRRVVLLSSQGAGTRPEAYSHSHLRAFEKAVQQSGLDWTILRPVEGTLDILGEPSGAEQRVSPDAEQVLGRPPRTFAEWAARNIAAFR